MNWKDHIVVNPDVLIGKPIIKGTRISVELLLDRFADGWSYDEILEAYPHLTREQKTTSNDSEQQDLRATKPTT